MYGYRGDAYFALTSSMIYYLCPHDVDMRKGIYSLYQLVKSDMGRNPLSGEVFLFLGEYFGVKCTTIPE